jgi:hypothetical protein
MGAASYPTLAPLQVSRQRWSDAPWNLRDLRHVGIFGTHRGFPGNVRPKHTLLSVRVNTGHELAADAQPAPRRDCRRVCYASRRPATE